MYAFLVHLGRGPKESFIFRTSNQPLMNFLQMVVSSLLLGRYQSLRFRGRFENGENLVLPFEEESFGTISYAAF